MVDLFKFSIIEKIPFSVYLEIPCITFKTEKSFIAHPWIQRPVVGLECIHWHGQRLQHGEVRDTNLAWVGPVATITRYLSSHIWCCHYLPPGSLLTLGHPNPFHIATSLLIWYKMFCMRDISYRLIWMKFISMLSVYANSGTHRRFDWWMIASFTQNPSVLMCVEITDAPKL